jgi:hypothetical protein
VTQPERFEFNGVELPFFDHEYNTTRLNERAVEIPITMWWLNEHAEGAGLEVGNVLHHYFPDILAERRVVDKYEKDARAENIDVFDIKGSFDYIFTISTLEHVGWDGDAPEQRRLHGASRALEYLYSLLAPAGQMLVSIPFGSNPALDYSILSGCPPIPHRETVMMRTGGVWFENKQHGWSCHGGTWVQAPDIRWERYGKSTPWAETVWFGEYAK